MKRRLRKLLFQRFDSLANSKCYRSTSLEDSDRSKKIAFHSFLGKKNAAYTGRANSEPFKQGHLSVSKKFTNTAEDSVRSNLTNSQKQRSTQCLSTSSFRRSLNHSRDMTEVLAAKDLLEQLTHTSCELSKLVRRAVSESKDIPGTRTSVLNSLDTRVSAIIDTIYNILSGWTPKRYQTAFQKDDWFDTENSSSATEPALPLAASLIRQLLVVDRALVKLLSITVLCSNTPHFNGINGRVCQWQLHSGIYSHLRWLINIVVQREMSWHINNHIMSFEYKNAHHQFVYQIIWKAVHCCRRRLVRQQFTMGEKPLVENENLLSISTNMLIGSELSTFQRIQSETHSESGTAQDERMSNILSVSSAEEWCMRWWLQGVEPLDDSENLVPLFGPSRYNYDERTREMNGRSVSSLSSSSKATSYPLSLQQAISVISLVVPRAMSVMNEKDMCVPIVSTVCGGCFVEQYVISLSYWFHRRVTKNEEDGHSGLFWIHSITLACRAVEFFPSSIGGDAFVSVEKDVHTEQGQLKGVLGLLFRVLVDAIPVIIECAPQLNGEHVSYLLHTFSLLGYSGNYQSACGKTKNLYVILAHRAGQIADVLKAHEMQRILQAVDEIQLRAKNNYSPHKNYRRGKKVEENKMNNDSSDEMSNTLRLALESAFRMKKIWK